MKAVIWHPDARQESDNALAASRDSAEFQQRIDEALHDIANGTVTHAQVAGSQCRRCAMTKYPYSIVYTETDDSIHVIAFVHHKRRSGYWANRLPKN